MTKPELQELDAETQIFTPKYVAQFLAINSISRLWLGSHPDIRPARGMPWYVECDSPDGLAHIESPEEIRVIDPACGTGNLLAAAFDTLTEIYRAAGYKPQQIPALILTRNLIGRDIDPAAAAAASAILIAKAHELNSHFFRQQITPDVRAYTADDDPQAGLFGSLIRTLDTDMYHVVIANPPYMGSKWFTKEMSAFAKREYPDSSRDLCAMFIDRGMEMLIPGGMIAMVTMQSWMFLSSFEALRKRMIADQTFITMAHLGDGVFGPGAVISTTAFVQANCRSPQYEATFFRLVDSKQKEIDLRNSIVEYRMRRNLERVS